jgi:hypothetical protein
MVEKEEISLEYVESRNNLADLLTKPLPKIQFERLRDMTFDTSSSGSIEGGTIRDEESRHKTPLVK